MAECVLALILCHNVTPVFTKEKIGKKGSTNSKLLNESSSSQIGSDAASGDEFEEQNVR